MGGLMFAATVVYNVAGLTAIELAFGAAGVTEFALRISRESHSWRAQVVGDVQSLLHKASHMMEFRRVSLWDPNLRPPNLNQVAQNYFTFELVDSR